MIKDKQREIFSLMEEIERKEKEWKKKEEELLATIKEREREIDQLKTEMKFRIEQLQAEIDELQESYDALKRKYDADLTGDNSVASLKASLDRLQKQLRDMQSRLEALMAKIKELRQTIREKDFEIEDTKRVCMDIVQQKEAAYQALLDDMNKIRDDYDNYKKMLQQKFFEMGQEFKKQKTTYESTIHNLEEELERERAVHVIVAELKAEIEKWKKKHQEEIDYREVLVKDLRETVELREKGIERLIQDCHEYEERIKKLKEEKEAIQEKCEAKLSKHERSWLKKKHEWDKRSKELDLEIQKLIYNLNDPEKAKRMKEKAEAEKRALEELKAKLEIQELEINAARIAVAEMAAENTDMRGLLGDRKAELGKDKEVLEKKMEQQNKRFKRLMVENEDLRRTLLAEMDRAEENLKDLEVQFLEMPNPFADEVVELRQGYDDNMKVVKDLSKNNFELTEELAAVKE